MNKITIVIVTGLFWIVFGVFVNYLSADTFLASAASIGNETLIASELNYTSMYSTTQEDAPKTAGGIINTFKILFGFGIPTTTLPHGLALFISSLNWLLLVVLGITLYTIIIGG